MPSQRFALFRLAGGLEDTGEVWQGKVGVGRNDGKGLDEASERTRRSFLMFTTMLGLDLASFYETLFTCLF